MENNLSLNFVTVKDLIERLQQYPSDVIITVDAKPRISVQESYVGGELSCLAIFGYEVAQDSSVSGILGEVQGTGHPFITEEKMKMAERQLDYANCFWGADAMFYGKDFANRQLACAEKEKDKLQKLYKLSEKKT